MPRNPDTHLLHFTLPYLPEQRDLGEYLLLYYYYYYHHYYYYYYYYY